MANRILQFRCLAKLVDPLRRLGTVLGLLLAFLPLARGEEPDLQQLEFFEKSVRPLLVQHCYECHSGEDEEHTRGGLRLDSREAALAGGDTGPSLVPGNAKESLLIDAINYGDLYQMPPKSKLSPREIETLTRWVEMGAPWPATPAVTHAAGSTELDIEAQKQAHWAWQPLGRPAIPAVEHTEWPRDPLDAFILAKLEQNGLTPAPEAPPAVWLRRVYFALIGLPPTPEEIEAFQQDPSPAAYAAVVDHLLNSPHFGERWGRHWLDLVRYAESRGHEFDYDIANAYHYRDYVIRALNADVPYDQFMVEHIAGDLLDPPRRHPVTGGNESILGTGFWFLGEWVHSPVDIRKDECDRFDNMVDVFSKTFLGLTVACARCHDHKFDPIPQADYYSLFGYLQSTAYRQVRFDSIEHNRQVAAELEALERKFGRAVADDWRGAQQPVLARMAEYLLAARELLQADAVRPLAERLAMLEFQEAVLPPEFLAHVEEIAAPRQLDAEVLARLAAHLIRVRGEPGDPLWLWAAVAWGDTKLEDATLRSWSEAVGPSSHPGDAHVVVDYSSTESTPWLTDGFAFGTRPRLPGQWHWEAHSGAYPLRTVTFGAARRDPAWNGLALAEGTMNEAGRLGSWIRAGQIVRTPTFEITAGPVHYLVRGSGVAYAAVDSHVLINGPLHGSLVMEFKTEGTEDEPWRWVTHDLGRYRGHRAHVEFSPLGDSPLEIYRVVQAPVPPPLPRVAPAEAAIARLRASWPANIQQLAETYQHLFSDVAGQFEAETAGGLAPTQAHLLDWMLCHSALFGANAQAIRGRHEPAYRSAREQLAAQIQRTSRTAPAMWEGTGEDERLLIRGNPKTPGPLVPRGLLTAISGPPQPTDEPGSGRLALARQLTDPANPFPSRVVVNRVWHHLMGRGIVASTDNFGVLGELPTHPELLDHLATSLIDDGWSLKRLIRRIVLSSTYRMSSAPRAEAEAVDPQNLWLHRMNIRRLEGEAIRDALLSLGGRLRAEQFGPSVPIHLTPFMQGRGRPAVSGPLDGNGRRSIYEAVRRNFLSPMMLAFDRPQPFSTVGRRSVSNVPAQALALLNDPLVVDLSRAWARRTLAQHPESVGAAIDRLYLAAIARLPSEQERAAAEEFFRALAEQQGMADSDLLTAPELWAELAHVLINMKEFIFVL